MISESTGPLVARVLDPISRYHDHRVEGLEHVPVLGPGLLVIHHSLATYDALLLAMAIWHRTGRFPAGLGHDRLFDVPGLRRLVKGVGVRRASPEAGRELLARGELVGVAPGGMREALRPSEQRYQVLWEARRGFARLAVTAQVPMILAACPRADELFDVEPHPITDWVYDNFRMPLPVARGRRGLPLPRKIPLVHYVAPPIYPPPVSPESPEAEVQRHVDALHARAAEVMKDLLARR